MSKKALIKLIGIILGGLLVMSSCTNGANTSSKSNMSTSTLSEAGQSTTNSSTNVQESTSVKASVSTTTTTTKSSVTNTNVQTVNISDYSYAGTDAVGIINEAVKSLSLKVASAKIRGEDVSYRLLLENKTYYLNGTIQFQNVNNVKLDGNNASFIWKTNTSGFYMKNCKNVTITNLNLDFDPMVYTQGTVTSSNGTQVTMTVDDGFPDNASWLFDTGKIVYSMLFNASTRAPKDGSSHTYSFSNIKRTSSKTLTMTTTFGVRDGVLGPVVGDKITLFNWAGPSTFVSQDCQGSQFINLNIYQSPGSALSESGGEGGTILKNVKVIPGPSPKGTNTVRLMSILSDAFHFGNVKKGPIIDGCTVIGSADDGVNVQGFFFHVLQVIGKKIIVTPKWDVPLSVGETIEGYKNNGYLSTGTAKITAFVRKNDASKKTEIMAAYAGLDSTIGDNTLIYEITLDKAISLSKGDHITSLDRVGSGAVIKNSTFKNNRARGVVVKGQNIVIENNVFDRNTSPAIVAHADIYWCESAFPVNVVIRGNKITNSAMSGSMIKWKENDMLGSILVGVSPPAGTTGFYNCMQNKNILIEGNTIENTQVYGIFVTNCNGITIKNNSIINAFMNGIGTAGKLYNITPTSGIFVGMSKGIIVTGNKVSGGKISKAVDIHSTCSGSIVNSNNKFN